ncbi:MAG: hypothetical protein OXF74_02570 [Rhodobacteraceae bacterium]|nr:hypothetical protein [Paracoccaceae bacterium]
MRNILTASIIAAALSLFGFSASAAAGGPPEVIITDGLSAAPDAPAASILLAHAGQLSPKDSCHREKARGGERHWHYAGTDAYAGPCIKRHGGRTFHLNNHAVCAEARILLFLEREEWGGDYRAAAEALRDCILDLPPPER